MITTFLIIGAEAMPTDDVSYSTTDTTIQKKIGNFQLE